LSGDEVRYELFAWVRGFEIRKGRFAKNTSPSSENAKAEQRNSQLNLPLTFTARVRTIHNLPRGLEVSRLGRMVHRERLPSPLSENTRGKK